MIHWQIDGGVIFWLVICAILLIVFFLIVRKVVLDSYYKEPVKDKRTEVQKIKDAIRAAKEAGG